MKTLKKIIAYPLAVLFALRSSYLAAYRATRKNKRFTLPGVQVPDMFADISTAINSAAKKAREQNMKWHVISPLPGKYCCVSERYFKNNRQFKSLHTLKP